MCLDCDRKHRSESDLHDHWEAAHFKCRRCRARCGSVEALRAHKCGRYVCPVCEVDFDEQGLLSAHEAAAHHRCRVCNEWCRSASDLQSHSNVHRAHEHQCLGCPVVFRTLSGEYSPSFL